MDFISILSIFVMACFVGHYVVATGARQEIGNAERLRQGSKVVNERLLG